MGNILSDAGAGLGTLVIALLFLNPERSKAGKEAAGTLWEEVRFGWRYLRVPQRHGLMALLVYFSMLNLIFGFIGVLIFPLILAYASASAVGTVFSVAALGIVAGSLVMSVWGGPKGRINGLLGSSMVLGIALMIVGSRASVPVAIAGASLAFLVIPIGNGSSQALWQVKVEPDVQGRVFAVRRLIAQIAAPFAYLAAGPLADNVFEPLFAEDGSLAGTVGEVIGVGPGRGIGFLFIILGLMAIATTVVAYLYGTLRNVERDIPDAMPDEVPVGDQATAEPGGAPPELESIAQVPAESVVE